MVTLISLQSEPNVNQHIFMHDGHTCGNFQHKFKGESDFNESLFGLIPISSFYMRCRSRIGTLRNTTTNKYSLLTFSLVITHYLVVTPIRSSFSHVQVKAILQAFYPFNVLKEDCKDRIYFCLAYLT